MSYATVLKHSCTFTCYSQKRCAIIQGTSFDDLFVTDVVLLFTHASFNSYILVANTCARLAMRLDFSVTIRCVTYMSIWTSLSLNAGCLTVVEKVQYYKVNRKRRPEKRFHEVSGFWTIEPFDWGADLIPREAVPFTIAPVLHKHCLWNKSAKRLHRVLSTSRKNFSFTCKANQ